MATKTEEPFKIKCSNCGYEWWSQSGMDLVSCPNCGHKTENPNLVESEGD